MSTIFLFCCFQCWFIFLSFRDWLCPPVRANERFVITSGHAVSCFGQHAGCLSYYLVSSGEFFRASFATIETIRGPPTKGFCKAEVQLKFAFGEFGLTVVSHLVLSALYRFRCSVLLWALLVKRLYRKRLDTVIVRGDFKTGLKSIWANPNLFGAHYKHFVLFRENKRSADDKVKALQERQELERQLSSRWHS